MSTDAPGTPVDGPPIDGSPADGRAAAPDRAPRAVLAEAVGYLALVATRRHYDEQPDLWRLGEHGRARTVEDYGHHFRALANLDPTTWARHVDYCERLFAERDYPRRWLLDAWRLMADTLRAEVTGDARDQALALLAGTGAEGDEDGFEENMAGETGEGGQSG